MKALVIAACLALTAFVMVSLLPSTAQQTLQAQSQKRPAGSGAPPLSNPLKVALLKWYPANETGITFPVGTEPTGVAFDGTNICVANYGSNNVTKLRASDGAFLGTFAVGRAPGGVTFDGANIWVSNSGTSSVTKLRASDGQTVGSFGPLSAGPYGVAFDGEHIWITGQDELIEMRPARPSYPPPLSLIPVHRRHDRDCLRWGQHVVCPVQLQRDREVLGSMLVFREGSDGILLTRDG